MIERCLAQELCRAHGHFQPRNCFDKFCLPRRTFPQLLKLIIVNLATRLHEQLFFPSYLRAPNHLRQHAAHHRFDGAAIIGADPAREVERLLAQDRRFADYCFDWPDTFRFCLFWKRDDCGERRFFAKRYAHARADSDSARQAVRNSVVELTMDGPINDDANVIGLCHGSTKLV